MSELIEPAVNGTVGMLKSAQKYGCVFELSIRDLPLPYPSLLFSPEASLSDKFQNSQRVKRVVVTSSVAAVSGIPSNPPGYTEADWNDDAVNDVRQKGRNASNLQKYRASKTLAERGN